ncbi:AraC family transcriptional regulator [Brumimicrobium glaciale]|uniref:AraC family transcriptional regulator n=1 Tax=Brumimicrobium glaciale TaxID=200475 RepID=A0A4Q4KL16_9FLAO|nr:AraC family transcriptional regulator [Brumimicrobium glaciale]RYM32509.1 AraC family transcriptional regulator [Brumimicrobium glaciale]
MKQKLLFILTLCSSFLINAQLDLAKQQSEFDSLYIKIYSEISKKDVDKAIYLIDSLNNVSTIKENKSKSIFLKSMLLLQKGETEKALQTAIEGEKFSSEKKLHQQQARFCGLLSSQYRLLGLFDYGEVYLKKGIKAGKKIKNDQDRYKFMGSIHLESASYELDKNNFTTTLEEIKLAAREFHKINKKETKQFYLTNVSNLKGAAYIGLEKYEKAIKEYRLAIKHSSGLQASNVALESQVLLGLGKSFLMMDILDSAYSYLTKTEEIAENSQFTHLKIEVYPLLTKYYKTVDDFDKYSFYNEKFLESYNQHMESQDKSVGGIIEKVSKAKTASSDKNWILITIIGLTILVIAIFIKYKNIKNKDVKRFNLLMDNFEAHKNEITENDDDEVLINSENITEEDQKILKLLEKHAQKDTFSEDCRSLPLIAKKLGTTDAHLNNLTHTHKGASFEAYMNKAMIICIINKIEKNPEFRKYKISALADEAGFSNKKKFNSVFKSVTGYKPSKFISLYQNNKPRREILVSH